MPDAPPPPARTEASPEPPREGSASRGAAEATGRGVRPPPVLREGAVFDGLLVLPGPGYIDGSVSGEVLAAGDVWVGPGGAVRADLEARTIIVEGEVEGDVVARERLELRETARVRGLVSAPRLCVAEGSVVDGPCETGPRARRESIGDEPRAGAPDGREDGAETAPPRPGSP